MSATVPELQARQITVGYGARTVIECLDLTVDQGQTVALVGPNGSGKSSLLRSLSRLLRPRSGQVLLDGTDIATLPTAVIARRLSVLPQGPVPPEGITVHELVDQGRYAHRGPFARATAADREAVTEALELTGTSDFADRYVDHLSGGERQRVWLALTIAQRSPVLLLDEPTTFLDLRHQLEVLELVDRLKRERSLTVVVVLHDLNQAARYADRIVMVGHGQVVADGTPAEVLTAQAVETHFGVRATITTDPVTESLLCLPHSLPDGVRP